MVIPNPNHYLVTKMLENIISWKKENFINWENKTTKVYAVLKNDKINLFDSLHNCDWFR